MTTPQQRMTVDEPVDLLVRPAADSEPDEQELDDEEGP